jgi:hypothetical protein
VRQNIVVGTLLCSALAMLAAEKMMRLDQVGVHLPDYTKHLASAF